MNNEKICKLVNKIAKLEKNDCNKEKRLNRIEKIFEVLSEEIDTRIVDKNK